MPGPTADESAQRAWGGLLQVHADLVPTLDRLLQRSAGLPLAWYDVLLSQEDVEALWKAIEEDPALEVTVDLEAKQVRYGAVTVAFEIDDYTRWRLLEGLDDVGLTERYLDDIQAYESARPAWKPAALPVRG